MPAGVATTRFSTEPSSPTSTASAFCGSRSQEFDMFEPDIVLASSARFRRRGSGPTTGSSSASARLRSRLPPRRPGPDGRCARAPRERGRRIRAGRRRRSGGRAGWADVRRWCAARRSGPVPRGPASRCAPRPATARSAACATDAASRPVRRSRGRNRRSGGRFRASVHPDSPARRFGGRAVDGGGHAGENGGKAGCAQEQVCAQCCAGILRGFDNCRSLASALAQVDFAPRRP